MHRAARLTAASLVSLMLAATVSQGQRHRGWPDPSAWPRFRCDISGIRLEAIKPYGKTDLVFTPIYAAYPPDVRAEIRKATKVRGYTHLVVDARPWYRDIYPSAYFYDRPREFKAILQELLDDGLMPVMVFDAAKDITHSTTVKEALERTREAMAAFVADRELMALFKIASIGWEIDDHMSPEVIDALARYYRSVLPRDALLFAHFTPRRAAGCEPRECAAGWWTRMAADNILDGVLYQHDGTKGPESLQDRLTDFTTRLVEGKHDHWPTRTGRGTPLYVIAFEYSAYWETHHKKTEEWGRALGDAAMQVPGVSGFCDGGTVR